MSARNVLSGALIGLAIDLPFFAVNDFAESRLKSGLLLSSALAAAAVAIHVIRPLKGAGRISTPSADIFWSTPTTPGNPMQKRQVTVTNRLGVHARPSAKIAQLAAKFRCNVSLAFNGRTANARNILAVMLLSASVGSTITVETSGRDEAEAVDALINLIGGRFGEQV